MANVYDVIVVGAGPVGNFIAYRLAKLGYKVLVIEKQSRIGEAVCCTGIVGKECYDRFPVARDAILYEVHSARLFSPSGRALELRKDTAQAYVVNRARFDDALAQIAQGEGAEFLLSARVDEMVSVDDGIRVKARCNGVTTSFEGRVAVLSNGFGGSLPKKTGVGRTGDFVLGAQVEVNTNGVHEVECYFGQSIAPGFFAWLVPTASDKALVGLLTRRNPGLYLEKLLSQLTYQGRVSTTNATINYGGIPLLPLKKTYGERLVVAGDAAGHAKPTTGGGIFFGLLCADIAADTVNEALDANNFSARKLSQYETKWRNLLGKELQVGYLARRIYENLNDSQIERIFDLIQSYGIHEELLEAPDFSFDWHSRHVITALRHRILGKTIQSITKFKLPNLD